MIELQIILVSQAVMPMTKFTHLTTRSEVFALGQNTFVVVYIILPTVLGSAIVSKTTVGKRRFNEMLTDSGLEIWRQSLNIRS